ncbi:MAG: hypothetical protein ACR5LC_11075 [Symbiopectobacterium sp.]|uniref:hypothetical protein n=1 Tax=Symbiopectobacterium sp. TaxID=2952789 RepID=UPI003F31BEAC
MLGMLIAVSVTRLIAKSIRGSLELAQRSSQEAREIEALIAEFVTRVDEGSVLVEKAGSAMHVMNDISVASDEQSRGIAQIGDAVTGMDRTIQENATMVSDSTSAALALEAQVARLASLIAVFRLPGNDMCEPETAQRPARFAALPVQVTKGEWV